MEFNSLPVHTSASEIPIRFSTHSFRSENSYDLCESHSNGRWPVSWLDWQRTKGTILETEFNSVASTRRARRPGPLASRRGAAYGIARGDHEEIFIPPRHTHGANSRGHTKASQLQCITSRAGISRRRGADPGPVANANFHESQTRLCLKSWSQVPSDARYCASTTILARHAMFSNRT
jgi:hypothetical protein